MGGRHKLCNMSTYIVPFRHGGPGFMFHSVGHIALSFDIIILLIEISDSLFFFSRVYQEPTVIFNK